MSTEERGGDKKGKRACSECHKSKSKCVYPPNNPERCERCIRLDKECIPHKSRQGKRKSDYSMDGGNNTTTTNNNSVFSEHSILQAGYNPQQQGQFGQLSQQMNIGQDHQQMEVTSSSPFSTPMAAALAMSNNNPSTTLGNHHPQSQQYIDNMLESMKQNGGGVVDGTDTTSLTNVNLLHNHCHMTNLLANSAAAGAATGGVVGGNHNTFSPAASLNTMNTHHLAQQIQNNTLFAKKASLLQQQQRQQQQQQQPQQHGQQPFTVGEGGGNTTAAGLNNNTGLNAILTRAMGGNRAISSNNTAVSAASTTTNNSSANIDMSGATGNGGLQGLSTNLLSGLSPAALNRMISHLSNNINSNAAATTGAGSGGGGGDVGSNNLDLLYQAANSQSGTNTTTTQQQQQQQGIVNYNAAGGNQLLKQGSSSTPSNSGTNGNINSGTNGNSIPVNNNSNNNNSESVGNNNGGITTNSNTNSMMLRQTNTEQRRNSTGGMGTTRSTIHPSPPLPSLPNINTKSAAAPVSSSNNNVINNSNNNGINNSTSNNLRNGNNNNKTINGSTNTSNNKAQNQIMRANDSRLKKQKKHHKYFPPEYPPISLLSSTTSNHHSISGTPCSSPTQAGDGGGGNLSRSSSTQNFITPEEAIGNHYMSACARHSELTLASLKYHYGLQCQIREWISMALARRSFALLSKASSLAHRCNMHMDRILAGLDDVCNEETCKDDCRQKKTCAGPRMHYLLSMLLEPQSKISIPIEDRHMLLPHFPPAFLSVIGCHNGQFFQESEIRNRWIIVRETRCGISRFFCSPAFERNVLGWAHVSQIYEDNLADIHSLIFVKDQFRRFLACNAYQIWSHSEKGMPPRPVHAPKTRIRLLSKRWGMAKYQDDGVTNPVTKTMIQQVDDVMTIEMDLLFVSFPTMDKTTYYLEFFHPAKNNNSSSSAATMNGNPPMARGFSNVSLNNMGAGKDLAQNAEQKSPESSSTNPPTFDDIMESEEWVGIDDVMASGDINELMDALLN